MNEPKRRLLLPSLNPNRPIDDNATQTSSGTASTRRTDKRLTSPDEATVHSLSTTASKPDRILRYGETVDTLFCLDETEDDEASRRHRKLCESLCGEKCDDAKAWAEALMYTVSRGRGTSQRLISLHRRVAHRFKVSNNDVTTSPNHDDVLKIWLIYAMVQLIHDSVDSATNTYKHVQRLFYSNESNEFYAALFDGELKEEVLKLKQSLDGGMKAVDVIEEQLRQLSEKRLLHSRTGRSIALPSLGKTSGVKETPSDMPVVLNNAKDILSTQQILQQPVTSQTDEAASDKRVIIQSSKRSSTQSADENKPSYRIKMEARKKARTDRLAAARSKPQKLISEILSQTMHKGGDSDEDNDAEKNQLLNCTKLDSTTPETNNDDWPQGNVLKSSAPDSDQARKHFKENISPIDEEGTASIKDMDLGYLLNWDPSKRETKKVTIVDDREKSKDLSREEKKVSKITRNDLGYMMNWEPFPKDHDGESKENQRSKAGMTKIEEEPTEASATAGGGNGITSNSGSTSTGESQGSVSQQKHSQKRSSMESHASPDKSLSKSELSQVETSFIPLIEKNNIITVDNEPYAKLSVAGKGGSCKVYRALSRELTVVALKTVNLEGLSKQSIDGYANEIALLKRLKGNPAIIQLYASEIDLERKSIYLVMELGEVDLNYVLRQQELLSTKQGRGGRSNLNMNFIRLTWQQMLSAVHSIHEERIVHSDLKPAVS